MKRGIIGMILLFVGGACVRDMTPPDGYTDRYMAAPPLLTVDSVTDITSDGAVLCTRIVSTGNKELKRITLCLSDTCDRPDTLQKVMWMDSITKQSGDTLLISLKGHLFYNTHYKGRLYVENIDSAAYSEVFDFRTLKNRGILTPELLAPVPDLDCIRVGVRCVYDEGEEPDLDSIRWGVVFADHPDPGFDDWHYAEDEEEFLRDHVFYTWIGIYKLQPDTDYYYRVYLTNKHGTVWTRESVFRVPPRKSPLIGDFQITDIREYEADLYFHMENAGGYQEYRYGVKYGKSADLERYGSTLSYNGKLKGVGWNTITCNGLEAGTTYYIRCFAENPQGRSYGPLCRFSTLPEDRVRASCWEEVQKLNVGVLIGEWLQMTCDNRLYLLVMEYDREEGGPMFEYDYRRPVGRLHRTAPFPGKCRQTCPAASLDGKIYVGPGLDSEKAADIWCFDPVADSWEKKLDFPRKYKDYSFIGFVAEEKWFLVSFYPIGERRVFLCYDPVGNRLEELPDAPYGEGNEAVCAFEADGRPFLLLKRGAGFTTRQIDFWEYLPGEKRWQYYAAFDGYWGDPPIVFRIDGRVYIGGGNWPSDVYPGMMEFDVRKGTLTRKHNLPDFAWNNCRTVLDGELIVSFLGDVWKYNPELDVPLGEVIGE